MRPDQALAPPLDTDAPAAPAATGSVRPAIPPQHYGLLYGTSQPMRELYQQIEKVAPTSLTVLIVGESGTGKELVARTLHEKSPRDGGPFIPVNCGAIPAALIEGELFGHEKGSFTGAIQQHMGYFERAAGGTIFLDEITEMAPEMQIKLLRVLETSSFHRVGGTEQICADVRVVAATNRDPRTAVREGRFREDLLYRLAVFPLRVPALRERPADIDMLGQRFLDQLNATEKTRKRFAPGTLDGLRQYHWPGNVRELKNAVHRAFILADDEVKVRNPEPPPRNRRVVRRDGSLELTVGIPLPDAQRELILATLAHFGGDKRQTASTLGISLKTLYNRLDVYKHGGDA
ncbi:MAG: sigma-54-dependent Fis family transcriptional regulator [Alcaligenaceae bacterium]|nr:sigma-54-dependent Fis family transcriptional regulator [Alcaligenaceae bacterium SAGV5]MPS55352.1 sigma-54-dependent Fis family transcriptional regulator [Alcaligenaceae bacterium SAGV3]MPT56563.1 sigma-54-dependent Fis family transcriptional regulator [Alcaligenaceae bacterium]